MPNIFFQIQKCGIQFLIEKLRTFLVHLTYCARAQFAWNMHCVTLMVKLQSLTKIAEFLREEEAVKHIVSTNCDQINNTHPMILFLVASYQNNT